MQTTSKKISFKTVIDQSESILGVYYSAGYPYLEATGDLARLLQESGADFIEIGMPYSDPLADGPVIEACHQQALKNGMSISIMFEQISKIKNELHIPVVLMGYFNPVFKYGIEKFCDKCVESGVDAVILPDMPIELYAEEFYPLFKERNISAVFLATPITPEERLQLIDKYSDPFVYLVSSSSTTGQTKGMNEEQLNSFKKIKNKMTRPVMVGFGISTHKDYKVVNETVDGAIIGSAFIRAIEGAKDMESLKPLVKNFVDKIKDKK